MKLGMETETIEYKKSTGELKEGIISIVAILNKHNGGELYFGIKNDGTAVGQDISEKTLRDVSQAISNHIEPRIFPDISNVVIDNKDCIRVAFEGENIPYYAYGRAYLRVADEDKVMSPQELESYIIKKNIDTTTWDSEPSDRTADDVNEKSLADYIEKANIAGRINYAYTDKHDILKRLNLMNGDKINNAAKIMFCDNINLEIQMATFATNERLTFLDIQRESGTIKELVDIAENYIKKNIRWRVEFDGGLQRNEIPEIPIDAVREALFNSYCHKDYRISQNNYVSIFKDYIEIYNPGTFPEGLTPQDFIEGSEQSVHRNPLLAQILYYSKDIESFGTGLRRIMKSCQEADVKVEFKQLKIGFSVIFHRFDKEVNFLGHVVTDKATDKTTDKSSREKMIIEYLNKNECITNKTVCELLSISDTTAKRLLKSMVDSKLIVAEGERKTRIYKL
jgi:Predicted transcriptional regulator containing an HTH domain and an uncharacterized domain shared with the mammalian protein Schlafen